MLSRSSKATSSGASAHLAILVALILTNFATKGAEALIAPQFVSSSRVSLGEGTLTVIPRYSISSIIASNFRSDSALSHLFPFQEAAESQVSRPPVNAVNGTFAVCPPRAPLSLQCVRPGRPYISTSTNEAFVMPQPPFTPANLSLSAASNSSLSLAWPLTPSILSYDLYIFWSFQGSADEAVRPDMFGDLLRLYTNISGSASSFTVPNLNAFSWYEAVLVAVHTEGAYGYRVLRAATLAGDVSEIKPLLLVSAGDQPLKGSLMLITTQQQNASDTFARTQIEVTNYATGTTTIKTLPAVLGILDRRTYLVSRIFNLPSFTHFSFRLRLLGDNTNMTSQWSLPSNATSPPALQPALTLREVVFQERPREALNISWHPQTPLGANLTYHLCFFDRELGFVQMLACKHPCESILLDAEEVRSGRIRFVTAQAANQLGNNTRTGFMLLTVPPAPDSRSAETTMIVLATVLPTAAVILAIVFVLYRRWQHRVEHEYYCLPEHDEWEIPRASILVNTSLKLGQGEFGIVFYGETLAEVPHMKPGTAIAVKTLSKGATGQRKAELIEEARRMKTLGRHKHRNIVQLYGVCMQEEPLLILLEYARHGTLASYVSRNQMKLSDRDLLKACLDVSKGMVYLSQLGFVHRDLAGRNCLVFESGLVKVGDFGLSRDMHYLHYYRKTGNVVLPVRWMAPECLIDGKFSTEGDVWSFGVVLWEVFTFGGLPYGARSNDEVFELVLRGSRLETPEGAPPVVEVLMKMCFEPTRPSFEFLVDELERSVQDFDGGAGAGAGHVSPLSEQSEMSPFLDEDGSAAHGEASFLTESVI